MPQRLVVAGKFLLKAVVAAPLLLALFAGCNRSAAQRDARNAREGESKEREGVPLPTGRYLEGGFAQASQDVGSLPVNLVLSPGGTYAVTTGAGFRQSLWSV